MRKGLVVTLGVVVLILAVSPGFAVAPIISCIPDVIISDVEQNSATIDNNFFVFSDALDLDAQVVDADTTASLLRWSFLETAPGSSIEINGLGSNVSGNFRDPGPTYNIRGVDQMASFRNILWYGVGGAGAGSMQSTVEMYVSDGVDTDSQAIIVTTEDDDATDFTDGTPDGLVSQAQASYDFASGAQGWESYGGGLTDPTFSSSGGRLSITKTSGQTVPVYGTWESPKDPSTALKARLGCVLPARYQMSSDVDGMDCPGFRFRALWSFVEWNAANSIWVIDFDNQDFNAYVVMTYKTGIGSLFYVEGREPGTTGQTYTLLYYPQQTATLMDDDAVVWVSADMLDDDVTGGDAGTIRCEQVDVDGFPRPAVDASTSVPALTMSNFAAWSPLIDSIGPGSIAGVTNVASASGVAIGCTTSDEFFHAHTVNDSPQQLQSGRYYRSIYTVSSTYTPGGDFHPLIRAGFASSKFAFAMDKEMEGGGLYSAISSPTEYEVWCVAPTEDGAGTGLTEAMNLRFASFLTTNLKFFFNTNVSGTITLSDVYTEVHDQADIAP
jgi:hypothetical protein